MKLIRSKLLDYEGCSVWFVTGLKLDLGNNPSMDNLYTEVAANLYEELREMSLEDEIRVRWLHNFSHFCGKAQSWFSVSDLSDYAQDLNWDEQLRKYC